jgi:hypothetical protein
MYWGFALSKVFWKGMIVLVRFLLPYTWLVAQEKLDTQMWGSLEYTGHRFL